MRPEEFQTHFSIPRETIEKFTTYQNLLQKWQKAINLVSPGTMDNLWDRHFADSAQIAALIPDGADTVVDLGSGAGFPGMVLAILRPDLKVHLIDSDSRKCEFLRTVSRETNIPVTTHSFRVEQILPTLNPSVITARAFAPLKNILDHVAESARQNPSLTLILLKGKAADDEIKGAAKDYEFRMNSIPSRTDGQGKILIVTDIKSPPAKSPLPFGERVG